MSKLNLYIVAGMTFHKAIRVESGGQPVDLSDNVYRAQLRETVDADQFVELVVETSQAADGILVLRASPVDTLSMFKGVWDLVETQPDGVKRVLVGGTVFYDRPVTR